jgi:hypothetical protein
MVQPIDYTMNVLNPIEGYMQGLKFGEDMLAFKQNRELAQSQEGRAQETFAMEKQDRASSIASAQAAKENAAAAQAGLVDYVNKLEAGTATPAELRAAMLKFPKMAETFQAFSNSVSSERLNTETTFAKQLAFALKKDPAQAKLLLQERADAALASGDEKAANVAKAQIIQIDQNPNAVLTQALMPLVTTMKPDEFDKFHTDVLGIGGGGDLPAEVQELQFRATEAGLVKGTKEYQDFMRTGGAVAPVAKLGFRAATPEEAAQFNATSGQIDQDNGRFYPFNPPKGMSLTVDKDGNISFVEGAGSGSGSGTGKKTTDYVYTTSETGEQIARPIAGTPAALEAQEKRSGLQARSDTAINMLATIESVVGRPAGNGLTAVEADPALPGILGLIEGRLPAKTQAQANLMAKYEQITGRAFLEAFETLKGGGQITETEGIKATQALGRLQRTQSPKVFKESLYEFSDIVRQGLARAQKELATIPEIAPAPSAATQPAANIPQSFLTNSKVIELTNSLGITPEAIWNKLSPEAKANYGN